MPNIPSWAQANKQTRAYYDNEWGQTPQDDRSLFECLALITFQVGLNWALVLSKRDRLRAEFYDFDPKVLSAIGPLQIPKIVERSPIRNEAKIRAVLTNARAFVAAKDEVPLIEVLNSASLYTPTALVTRLRSIGFIFIGARNIVALCEMIGLQPPQSTEDL